MVGYHFIFALDESCSMSGKPWEELSMAFNNFMKTRL